MATKRPLLRVTLKSSFIQPSSDEIFSSRWKRLESFLNALYLVQTSPTGSEGLKDYSYEELYGSVVDICSQNMSDKLFSRLCASLETRASLLFDTLPSESPDAGVFLARVRSAWGIFCSELSLQRSIFQHLDRSYLACQPGSKSLFDVGVNVWGLQLSGRRRTLLELTADSMCREILRERRGESIDREVMSSLTHMLVLVSLFADNLHDPLLECTAAFYEEEGLRLINSLPIPQYLVHVENRLLEERERILAILNSERNDAHFSQQGGGLRKSLLGEMISRMEDSLIARHTSTILSGLPALLSLGQLTDLRRLYGLITRVRKLDAFRAQFSSFVKTSGAEIVGKGEDEKDKVMVQCLLDFKDAMAEAISVSFSSNPTLTQSLRAALENCINARQDRPAELIAKYVDAKMRVACSGAAWEGEMEKTMDKVLQIFRCIHGKDVFEAFYKKDLAKRLLLGRSSSTDMEKAMVAKLKSECGANFTSKLECMFKDVEISRVLCVEFRGEEDLGVSKGTSRKDNAIMFMQSTGGSGRGEMEESTEGIKSLDRLAGEDGGAQFHKSGIDLYVNVLTASHWPTYPQSPKLYMIPSMTAALEGFEAFFRSKHASRKLVWVPHVSTCLLRANFSSCRKDLDVSQHQALVLLLFNDTGSSALSCSSIQASTGIEMEELKRTLQSLALGQVRVLKKEQKGREVEDSDTFVFNAGFSHALVRIKINQIQAKETKQEVDSTHERVVQDRQFQVDAALVRIMKARKVISHVTLMGELISQLRFPCDASVIKKRIESLIDRDYLERHPDDPSQYRYVA